MFNISKLDMYNYKDELYSYAFENGINYFIGKNNSGKTEFYKFIDYMFGSSETIKNSLWYKGSLKKAIMFFTHNKISYRLTRIIDNDKCYFSYQDEDDAQLINLDEYKDRLQAVFSIDKTSIEKMHKFTNERLTYRSFTLFNFLGEIRQGVLIDFFDKCSKIEYSTKIMPILNYIFNKNVERIFWLKNEILNLQQQIAEKEKISESNKSIIHKVNLNLHKLNMNEIFTGSNGDIILANLSSMIEQLECQKPMNTKSTTDLEIMCSNIDEQIKNYEKYKTDLQEQQHENKNRASLLETFKDIILNNGEFEYLIAPLIELTNEINNSISFSQYILKDEVLGKLKKQRETVKEEILKANIQLTRYTFDDKKKAIAIAEDGINSFSYSTSTDELKELKDKLKMHREELRELQNSDDTKKINLISNQITQLYKSLYETCSFVKDDFDNIKNFYIKYIKNRNALQTMMRDEHDRDVVYVTGSHARHTLIQLCGYLVFMKLLINENKYPIIPIIVIDHISKSFDNKNIVNIGKIIHKAYESIGIENLQIFIFDDKDCEKMSIRPNQKAYLYNDAKTGFNPFFNPEKL